LESVCGGNVTVGSPQSFDGAAMSNDMANPIKTMFYVYILLLRNNQFYTGYASDLKRRIGEHERGKVVSTKFRRPVKLVHYEAYLLKSDAQRREKYLKTTEGKAFLRKQIRDLFGEIRS
jgi:putative endonuclease